MKDQKSMNFCFEAGGMQSGSVDSELAKLSVCEIARILAPTFSRTSLCCSVTSKCFILSPDSSILSPVSSGYIRRSDLSSACFGVYESCKRSLFEREFSFGMASKDVLRRGASRGDCYNPRLNGVQTKGYSFF